MASARLTTSRATSSVRPQLAPPPCVRLCRLRTYAAPAAVAQPTVQEAPVGLSKAGGAVQGQAASGLSIQTGKVLSFGATDFDQLLCAAGTRLVVVDVYTTWCGPCKMIAPEVELMAEEFGDKAVITKMDCTSNPDNKKWAMAQGVKALPTFLLFKQGKRVNDMTGAKAANLRKLIEAHI